jgi:hypothetical protein
MRMNTLVHPLARRIAWALAAIALVVMLALAACGTGASQTSGNNNPSTTGTTGSGSGRGTGGNSAVTQQAQNADQQIQAALQAMDNAQNDANTDYSSQDNPIQP